MEVLQEGYCTIKEASDKLGTTYDALRMWINRHGVQKKRVVRAIVIRFADVEQYQARTKSKVN